MIIAARRLRAAAPMLVLAGLLAGCSTPAPKSGAAAEAPKASASGALPPRFQVQIDPGPVSLKEGFVARREASAQLVGLAFARNPVGAPQLYVGDASTDEIVILDAPTGRFLQKFGSRGSAEGEFQGLTDLYSIDGMLFVAEAGNRRVQMFYLPERNHLATFGEQELKAPQSIFVRSLGGGRFLAYVADLDGGQLQLKTFEISSSASTTRSPTDRSYANSGQAVDVEVRTAGVIPLDATPGTRLWLQVDSANNHLVIAYADRLARLPLQEPSRADAAPPATLAGITGTISGLGLFACANSAEKGYWIVSDRSADDQLFRVYDRITLAPVTSFRGEQVRDSAAMLYTMETLAYFNYGGLFALNQGTSVGSFSWDALAAKSGVRRVCL